MKRLIQRLNANYDKRITCRCPLFRCELMNGKALDSNLREILDAISSIITGVIPAALLAPVRLMLGLIYIFSSPRN